MAGEAGAADFGMQYAYCTANDGSTLAFQTSLPIGAKAKPDARYRSCILLLHGFSGSSAYFTHNFSTLSEAHWIIAPDMRGHGNSARTRGGYHVSRLAADLKDIVAYLRTFSSNLAHVRDTKFVPVGCSIGAAVLWTYVELFGHNGGGDFAGFVFVDQAPLQDRSPYGGGWDASRAHTGCYDELTAQAAQRAWIGDPTGTHRGLVQSCLGYRHAPEPDRDDLSEERQQHDEAFFTRISARCDGEWLARLLADHTRYDHREAIEENVRAPTLVMAGRRSGCFPLEGMRETVRRIEVNNPGLARMSVFDSGHWLFYEEPEKFNKEIIEFVDSCIR